MKSVRILVADRDPAFLLGTVASLLQFPQVDVVGYTSDAGEALDMVEQMAPDIFVFDQDMLVLSEWEALWRLRGRSVPARVVITAHQVSEETCAGACAVGADVCVSKDEMGSQLCRAVGAVAVHGGPASGIAAAHASPPAIPRPVRRAWMPREEDAAGDNPWWHGVARQTPRRDGIE